MRRVSDVLPAVASELGIDRELKVARQMAAWRRIVAERVPAAAGGCRVLRLDGFDLVVEADAPIVAQELRLRTSELLAAFAASPAGTGARELRIHVRRGGARV